MTIKEALHQFIDEGWDTFIESHQLVDIAGAEKPYADMTPALSASTADEPAEAEVGAKSDVRVVRTPASGDKVYLLSETDMTKKWVRTPEMLKEAGFTFGDVQKIEDSELSKYKLTY